MAREDWWYPNLPKTIFSDLQGAIREANKGLPRPKYGSPRDFVIDAVVEKLQREGLVRVKA